MRYVFAIAVAAFFVDAAQCTRVGVEDQSQLEVMDHHVVMGISCGGHKAPSCSQCPQGHGESWCNGDCKWVQNGSAGDCQPKARPVAQAPPSGQARPGGRARPGSQAQPGDQALNSTAQRQAAAAAANKNLYDYEKQGICCKKKDRWEQDIIRWFYHITPQGKIKKVKYCPKSWSPKKGYCAGKEAHNLASYTDNTDWVYCCKAGDKDKYTFYQSSYCQETGNYSCSNWDCTVAYDVFRGNVVCPAGTKRYQNRFSTYYCRSKPPEHLGITDADCAGFITDCAKKQCMFQSKQTTSVDCTSYCELAQHENGTNGWYPKKKPSRGGAGTLAMNCVVMLFSILSIM
mmetsp:Transcript_40176/g.71301  ORF Transcript_40176/g.71301 Transcript_40176/m.71301 type:complete len:344 (-) Transcript_40176:42-1073(-)